MTVTVSRAAKGTIDIGNDRQLNLDGTHDEPSTTCYFQHLSEIQSGREA